jgi:hypothetical protein
LERLIYYPINFSMFIRDATTNVVFELEIGIILYNVTDSLKHYNMTLFSCP